MSSRAPSHSSPSSAAATTWRATRRRHNNHRGRAVLTGRRAVGRFERQLWQWATAVAAGPHMPAYDMQQPTAAEPATMRPSRGALLARAFVHCSPEANATHTTSPSPI
eukprot:1396700-Prymnesium_polylepis.1